MLFTKASVSCFLAGKMGSFSVENLASPPLIMVNCHIVSYKRCEANRNVLEVSDKPPSPYTHNLNQFAYRDLGVLKLS